MTAALLETGPHSIKYYQIIKACFYQGEIDIYLEAK